MKRYYPLFLQDYANGVREVYTGWRSDRAAMLLKYSLMGAFIFCMAAHAFAYFNFAPLHDGANYVDNLAGGWEVSLGRFLQPMYGDFRGRYTMPWMSGMLSMLYIGLAAFLINDLFEVEDRMIALLTSGFLAANTTMTNLTMVFSYVTDVFALALLLACIGAYLVIRLPNLLGVFLGSVCYAASMGLYQSYVLVGGLLLVIYAMLQAVCDRQLLRHQASNWLRYIAAILLTGVVYYVMYKCYLSVYGTQVASASAYNSPARLATLDLKSMIPLVGNAYESFMVYFFGMKCRVLNFLQMGTIGLFALGGVLFTVYVVKERLPLINLLLVVLGALLFPGAGQVVSILAQHGRIYFLTAHAVFLMYPALLAMIGKMRFSGKNAKSVSLIKRSRVFVFCVYALCGVVLFGNIRYSNEMYTYRMIQYDKTISYVTRLMERIDSIPGYVRNETEVVFVGDVSAGLSNVREPDGWEWLEGMHTSGATYPQVLRSYVRMMGERMNIPLDYSALPDYASMAEVQDMPAFPSPGCCTMIDGRVLVKLTGN